MKIIFLNAWHGKMHEEITAYLNYHVPSTDVFCFQEADGSMQTICRNILTDYAEFVAYKTITSRDTFSQAIYVKKSIPVMSHGTLLEDEITCGLAQYVEIKYHTQNLFICNLHGISYTVDDKLDNPSRLLQSQLPLTFFKDKRYALIGGDFNMLPEARSMRMFEEQGYRDIIKSYKITTTRNHLVWDRYPNNKLYYSDYIFTSPSLHILTFTVPDNTVSDHLPLEIVTR